jgi:hypothetical protein
VSGANLTTPATRSAATALHALPGTLVPGGGALPLNLTLANPNKQALSITNLTVTVQSVQRTPAAFALNLPCSPADYSVTSRGNAEVHRLALHRVFVGSSDWFAGDSDRHRAHGARPDSSR